MEKVLIFQKEMDINERFILNIHGEIIRFQIPTTASSLRAFVELVFDIFLKILVERFATTKATSTQKE